MTPTEERLAITVMPFWGSTQRATRDVTGSPPRLLPRRCWMTWTSGGSRAIEAFQLAL